MIILHRLFRLYSLPIHRKQAPKSQTQSHLLAELGEFCDAHLTTEAPPLYTHTGTTENKPNKKSLGTNLSLGP